MSWAFTIAELRYAQKYPFSPLAKSLVESSTLTMENIPDLVVRRARAIVAAAFSDQQYMPKISESADMLKNEILAFPVSKIIVSLINRLELYRKYAIMVSDSAAANLYSEKDQKMLLDMAQDLGLRFYLSEEKDFFAEIPVADYLMPDLDEKKLKLVNQKILRGKVFLSKKQFVSFLCALIATNLKNSLPLDVSNVPQYLKSAADELEKEFADSVRKKFSRTDFGKVSPEAFPPCMAKIYSDLLSGANVNHSARFAMATFFHSIGMSPAEIINMYRSTPNFNEKITRYQVERITGFKGNAGKSVTSSASEDAAQFRGSQAAGYSCPSCDRMRSYNLCVANCPVSHPVQFYSREISRANPQKLQRIEEEN